MVETALEPSLKRARKLARSYLQSSFHSFFHSSLQKKLRKRFPYPGAWARIKRHLSRPAPGESLSLIRQANVVLHPSAEWVGLIDRINHEIQVYRKNQSTHSQFSRDPCYRLSEEHFAASNLTAPQGLTFSRDGKYLIVTHKSDGAQEGTSKDSAISFYCLDDFRTPGEAVKPSFVHHAGKRDLSETRLSAVPG